MSIKKQAFGAGLLPPEPDPGEIVFAPDGTAGSMTQTMVVPANVYFLSVLCVGQKNSQAAPLNTRISRGGTVLLGSDTPLGGGVGGGNGGIGGSRGHGGAGGYSGNGGNGSSSTSVPGTAGQGGGGGGGSWDSGESGVRGSSAGYGGPIGLLGQGANGTAGILNTTSNSGGVGSPPSSGIVAGAGGGSGSDGGDVRWKNDIPVIPGETLTITFGVQTAPNPRGTSPALRAMWGGGRSFPANAPATVAQGQQTFTASNTTWTVPAGVTSICACAQQKDGNSAAVSLVVAGSTVLRAQNGNRLGDGGGDGGASGGAPYGGGGGAGGYSGNGGHGGAGGPLAGATTWDSAPGGNGNGGAGAGGHSSSRTQNPSGPVFGGSNPNPTYTDGPASPGGGVGISGAGASGPASGSLVGSPDPIEGNFGGGAPGVDGGALAYKNSIAVTPGQVITVNAAGGRVRIIWGPGRSYPSNAGKV